MAAETIVGVGVLHGIQNDGSAITITGYATFLLERLEGEHQFENYFVKDPLGFDASGVAFNEHAEIMIDFVPSGATRAAAATIPFFPIPLSSITLSHCKVQTAFGSSAVKIFDGAYLYIGGSRITMQSAAVTKQTGIKLRKYADATQNTSMTTLVVG